MSSNTRLTMLKHSITNSFIQKGSQSQTEFIDDDDYFCIVPVETKRGDERASRSSSRRKRREQFQRDRKSLSAKCLWPNLSIEEKVDSEKQLELDLPEEIPYLNTAIKESSEIEIEVQKMLDSVQKISKKCGKAPTNYLQRLLPGIDLDKYEYLTYTFESVINEANFSDLKSNSESLNVQSENFSMPNMSSFSDLMLEQSSESLVDHSSESPIRKIPEIWNTHNKLHCEKIKLRYHLQSTKTALDRTIAASKKLPLSSQSNLMKFNTPIQETKFLRRTNSTSKCYVKKKSYSFEKFTMSSSFSEVSKWQR